jgi:hypothetical protein
MTLPVERYRAIGQTQQFLIDLLDGRTYPRVPRAVKAEASRLLRHYPSQYHIDRLAEQAPDIIRPDIEPLTRMIMRYEQDRQ